MAELITVVCDCDHDDVNDTDDRRKHKRSEVISFTVDGVPYEFDGCEFHCTLFRKQMAIWIGWARRQGKTRTRIVEETPARRPGRTPEIGGTGDWWSDPSNATYTERMAWRQLRMEIKDWARRNKEPLGDRGRIPAEVAARYAKHMRGQAAAPGTSFREGAS